MHTGHQSQGGPDIQGPVTGIDHVQDPNGVTTDKAMFLNSLSHSGHKQHMSLSRQASLRGAGTPFLIIRHRHLGQAGESNARYTHRTAPSQVGAPVSLSSSPGQAYLGSGGLSSRLPGEEPGDPSSHAAGLLLEGCVCFKPGAWGRAQGITEKHPSPHTQRNQHCMLLL